MVIESLSLARSHGGMQDVYGHDSFETRTGMTFSVFVPPGRGDTKYPVVWYLSGLTCTHANVTEKGEFRRACAELGVIFVAPDTSPRGKGLPGDPQGSFDFRLGMGFYVDASQVPFAKNYRMWSYITEELLGVMAENFPADMERQTILAHSMGGHRALTIALRNPQRYRAASAFSPIVAPSQVPWGIKALNGYLGEKRRAWREYDAVALIEDGARLPELLVDCGDAAPFLAEQLRSELLKRACADASIPLNLRHQNGFDHSYHFVSTFMEEHLRWHADRLRPCDRLASNKASPSRGRNCLHAPYLQPKCAGQSLMTPKKLAGL